MWKSRAIRVAFVGLLPFLIALASCGTERNPADKLPDAGVQSYSWALYPEIVPQYKPASREVVAEAGASAEVTVRFTVRSAVCAVTAETGEVIDGCQRDLKWLDGFDDPESLSATGEVVVLLQKRQDFEFEEQYQEVNRMVFPVGRLNFGNFVETPEVTFELDHLDKHDIVVSDYRITAHTLSCRLSNGSACSNAESREIFLNVLYPDEAETGSSSQGLTSATATPAATSAPAATSTSAPASPQGLDSNGWIVEILPNPNNVMIDKLGSRVEMSTDSSGMISGIFTFEWWFASNPDTRFTESGTMTGTRNSARLVSGEYQLDDPGGDYLSNLLAGSSGAGEWTGTVLGMASFGEWVNGSFFTTDGSVLKFELGLVE